MTIFDYAYRGISRVSPDLYNLFLKEVALHILAGQSGCILSALGDSNPFTRRYN